MSNIIETNNEFLKFLLKKSKNDKLTISVDITSSNVDTRLSQKLQFTLENIILSFLQVSLSLVNHLFLL